ncbi:unnamed protein product [Arctogadus glacialis]
MNNVWLAPGPLVWCAPLPLKVGPWALGVVCSSASKGWPLGPWCAPLPLKVGPWALGVVCSSASKGWPLGPWCAPLPLKVGPWALGVVCSSASKGWPLGPWCAPLPLKVGPWALGVVCSSASKAFPQAQPQWFQPKTESVSAASRPPTPDPGADDLAGQRRPSARREPNLPPPPPPVNSRLFKHRALSRGRLLINPGPGPHYMRLSLLEGPSTLC